MTSEKIHNARQKLQFIKLKMWIRAYRPQEPVPNKEDVESFIDMYGPIESETYWTNKTKSNECIETKTFA